VSAQLERLFPNLADDGYRVSSPESAAYNCVAWATGESHRWWQPGIYWPIRPGDDLGALVALFLSLGYDPCDDDGLEAGYEKVALYADHRGDWTHAARQLPDGWWTSKLGQDVDILHRTPRALVGEAYGEVRALMSRATIRAATEPRPL
jgi:hypothetical protein